MSRAHHQDIRVGTLAPMDRGADYLRQVLPHGFESFELTLWQYVGNVNLEETAKAVIDVCGDDAVISSVGIYGNPLQDEKCATDWERVIRAAPLFGAGVVCGFAGALEDRPVDESMPKFKEVFGRLAKLAEDAGVKIAFENCDMGGTWERPHFNIAHSPRAWEMMFDAVPGDTLGLEWEPCHQMVSLIDPIAQLRQWVGRVHHVHGKDATVAWDVIERSGLRGGETYVWHRTPGFGDTNWTDVITILRQGGFEGAIDIEGWHDPIYRDELEMTGQVYALQYLQACRGGDYIENPK
ncbi:MAG: sugar phosphate isomerase/epimerase [Fimbriimonadaceae bacterium]|nr:sugar phosphate isomerase/epimerase [Chthonomonadaceae bacterium]MCO5295901.1 sugar phosphate isomerase/epimerase [Fimbriimonadaceae bacterium]